jgi:hypothetical protein
MGARGGVWVEVRRYLTHVQGVPLRERKRGGFGVERGGCKSYQMRFDPPAPQRVGFQVALDALVPTLCVGTQVWDALRPVWWAVTVEFNQRLEAAIQSVADSGPTHSVGTRKVRLRRRRKASRIASERGNEERAVEAATQSVADSGPTQSVGTRKRRLRRQYRASRTAVPRRTWERGRAVEAAR